MQQRTQPTRVGTGLEQDRQSALWLSGFAAIGSIAYLLVAPFVGSVPTSSWIAMASLVICTSAGFAFTYFNAVRAGVLLTIAGIWLPAVMLLTVAGRDAPAAELFTVTVVFAALAAGRRVAAMVTGVSLVAIAMCWIWLPLGIDPSAGAQMLQRRPLLDVELLVFGALLALWWSWRTERVERAHEELEGNAQIIETLRQAVESSRAGIAIADADGVLTFINDALSEMWRLPDPRLAIGRTVFDFWAEPEVARVALVGFAEGTQPVALLRGLRADGVEFDVEVSGSRVVSKEGRIDGYIGSFIDVTERNLAETRLSKERERTRAIVESVLDIVIILDATGTIIFENAAVQRVLGFEPGERVGQSILEHAHPDDVAGASAAMGSLYEDADRLARIMMRFRHKDGSWRWLETFGRNLTHVPAIGGILGVGRDVTEQREMQARLDASERLETVGRLAGGVAHDFNNLLTAILGNAELARELPTATGDMGRYLDGVMQASERARDLTRKLLAFARREITQPVVTDLRARIHETQDLLYRILGEDIRLIVETGAGPLPVLIDPVHFEQVILNLAVNARDAMPSGGTFSIHGERVHIDAPERGFVGTVPLGAAVRLTVTDSGMGMAPEVVARVFEPFFTTKELGRGTGLGLSTAYGSVVQAGGAIRVASQVGVGTSFEILLPRSSDDATAVASEMTRPMPRQSGVVLVAEDDASVRAFMVEVLVNAGCRVLEAEDGVEGAAVIDAHRDEIDLLVTDVVMPNRNGIDLAHYFRDARPDSRTLFVTGYSKDPTIEKHAEQLGAQVLLKPFTVDQLLGHVRRQLKMGAEKS